MLNFKRITPEDRETYHKYLCCNGQRGCEYSFVNMSIWGRQYIAESHGCMVLFSQFNRRTVYPFPVGSGDIKAALEAVIHDVGNGEASVRSGNSDVGQGSYIDSLRYLVGLTVLTKCKRERVV